MGATILRAWSLGAAAFLASTIAACAVQEPEPVPPEIASAAQALNLIAFARTPTGGTIEFYEPMPGQIVFSRDEEAGTVSPLRGVDLARATPRDIYALAAPGQEVPDELIAAYERAALVRASAPLPDPAALASQDEIVEADDAPGDDDKVVKIGAVDDSKCTAEWFQEQHCGEWCWLHRTGSTRYYHGNVTTASASVCPYRGEVQMHVKFRPSLIWKEGGSWTVLEGHVRTWDHLIFLNRFDIRSSVGEADGDGYHHGGYVD